MPHPNQIVSREWNYPTKRKALTLFCERNPLTAISVRLGIPVSTLYRWSREETWRAVRSQLALNLSDFVTTQRSEIERLLIQTLRICAKLNDRVEESLERGDKLDAKNLERLATAFQRNSDTLLRLLGR